MDVRLHIRPEHVLRWQGGRVHFRPLDGAVMEQLVDGKRISLLDIVRAIKWSTSADCVVQIDFSLRHIRKLLIGSPFRLTESEGFYQLLPKIGKTVDKIASIVAEDGNSEDRFNV